MKATFSTISTSNGPSSRQLWLLKASLFFLATSLFFQTAPLVAQAPFYCSIDGLPMETVDPSYAGLSIKELNPFAGAPPPREVVAGHLQDAGVQKVNSRLLWWILEPSPGDYQWSFWDPLFETFISRGVDPIVAIQFTPPWASSQPSLPAPHLYPPADLEVWTNSLTAIVQHYDQVSEWEIWSEPNIENAWLGTEEEYLEMLAAAYPAVHAAREGVRVWGPGIGLNTWNVTRDIDFVQAVIDQGTFDVFTIHLYFFEISEMAAIITDVRARLDAAGHEDVPLAVTEVNLVDSIVDCGNYNQLPEEAVANILSDMMSCFANAGADYVFWFKSSDTGPICADDGVPTKDGILDASGAPKAAYHRLAEVIDYLESPPPEVFEDGFETGDVSAWGAVP